jgi:glycerol-3-phosphate dehydrogenase (NAD(P)+)
MQIDVAVLGGGSWGTTVASLTAKNASTVLWARDSEVAAEVDAEHQNSRYLAGFELTETLRATDDLEKAVRSADVVVMGVPSHGFRATLEVLRPHLRAWVPVVSLAKGLEQDSNLRMTEVIQQELPGHPYGVLTGPNLAKEILAGDAAASVIAMSDETIAVQLQHVFSSDLFRVYTNHDLVGCEVAGALKNVIAIASGMADGLGTGDNTRAAVITRGLSELSRLGVELGGEPMTFAGLAGMGDLLATCISPQSRNRTVGVQLGQGKTIEQIIDEMQQVAEGVKTAKVVHQIALDLGLDLPIVDEVYHVLYEGRSAADAYRGLLRRQPKREMEQYG